MLDTKPAPTIPFDTKLLDRLMEEAGVDVLLATSSTMSNICSAAIVPSSSTTWTLWA